MLGGNFFCNYLNKQQLEYNYRKVRNEIDTYHNHCLMLYMINILKSKESVWIKNNNIKRIDIFYVYNCNEAVMNSWY